MHNPSVLCWVVVGPLSGTCASREIGCCQLGEYKREATFPCDQLEEHIGEGQLLGWAESGILVGEVCEDKFF